MFKEMMGGAPKTPDKKPKYEKIDSAKMESILNGFDLDSLRKQLMEDVKKKHEEYQKQIQGNEWEFGYLNNLDRITKALENENISNSDLLTLKSLVEVL